MSPLVTVIALCYNHEKFVEEALKSVVNQTYNNVELVIVDDASTDESVSVIKEFLKDHKEVKTIFHKENKGNCKSFNEALREARGEFIIDFATDDVMFPDMLEKQIHAFEKLSEDTGLLFANAVYINEQGKELGFHYKESEPVVSGNVYEEVIKRFYIAPPSMIMRKTMLNQLGGYDESLAYEDFDLWVRAARNYKFYYLSEVVVKKRQHSKSLSKSFYKPNNSLQESTYRVCQKILWLNKTSAENKALAKRVSYEMKTAFLTQNFSLVKRYLKLLEFLNQKKTSDYLIAVLAGIKLRVGWLYALYRKLYLFSF